jgi:DNA modification methylase
MAQNAAALPLESSTAAEPAPRERGTGGPMNDLDLKNWKRYEDLLTDSLWIIPERDGSGAHCADYHGNFVPQIPYQMMQRFTKRGDVVLDPFLGSGTTLIEARRLGRHAIGVELQEHVAAVAKQRIDATEGEGQSRIYVEDSTSHRAYMKALNAVHSLGRESLQLIMVHPPYHDIIRFSDRPEDLSNAATTDEFRAMFGKVLDNFLPLLERGRHLCLVIGDKYAGGEWVPLGFHLMQEALTRGMQLKSLIVKNMAGNRAKRNKDNLWRYRALYGGFYIFKHEYVMLFKKP